MRRATPAASADTALPKAGTEKPTPPIKPFQPYGCAHPASPRLKRLTSWQRHSDMRRHASHPAPHHLLQHPLEPNREGESRAKHGRTLPHRPGTRPGTRRNPHNFFYSKRLLSLPFGVPRDTSTAFPPEPPRQRQSAHSCNVGALAVTAPAAVAGRVRRCRLGAQARHVLCATCVGRGDPTPPPWQSWRSWRPGGYFSDHSGGRFSGRGARWRTR